MRATRAHFSALQRAENSSISTVRFARYTRTRISVLFSEPKIPQFSRDALLLLSLSAFSALQRAENSSIPNRRRVQLRRVPTFSALQRAENSSITTQTPVCQEASLTFSALQRAENSSIAPRPPARSFRRSFSALQRAENSSIPSPHLNGVLPRRLSVLFSEPKIPQLRRGSSRTPRPTRFQCSSASRKFLN